MSTSDVCSSNTTILYVWCKSLKVLYILMTSQESALIVSWSQISLGVLLQLPVKVMATFLPATIWFFLPSLQRVQLLQMAPQECLHCVVLVLPQWSQHHWQAPLESQFLLQINPSATLFTAPLLTGLPSQRLRYMRGAPSGSTPTTLVQCPLTDALSCVCFSITKHSHLQQRHWL